MKINLIQIRLDLEKNSRTSTLIEKYVQKNGKFYTCFVDFQKAFDKVWRTGLLHKLLKFNIRGKFYDMIKNIYSKTYSCIKNNGSFSAIFETNTGVKQGEPLSPLLFNIYLNDLVEYLGVNSMTPTLNEVKINSLLYADDLALVATSSEDLQVKLNLLHE